jgi:glycosyltransferase involved in cell wall biosynthesis
MNASNEKLLTVCVSTYNRACKLESNLENWYNLNNHKSNQLEFIVCDNFSTLNLQYCEMTTEKIIT